MSFDWSGTNLCPDSPANMHIQPIMFYMLYNTS